jgi:hypothetical protein
MHKLSLAVSVCHAMSWGVLSDERAGLSLCRVSLFYSFQTLYIGCRYTPPPPLQPRAALDPKCDDLVSTPGVRSAFFNFTPNSCFR